MKTKQFIEKALAVHGDKYDYSKVVYTKSCEKVIVVCNTHGEFSQVAGTHLKGSGCPKCSQYGYTTEKFISKVSKIHGNRYTYNNLKFNGVDNPITITCGTHGDFTTIAANHLYSMSGCPKCALIKKTTTEFISEARKVHSDRYDYAKSEYVDSRVKLIVGCKTHGDFQITPDSHLKNHGCPKCSKTCLKTNDEFIADAITVHGDTYDYSLVNYLGSKVKVSIICKRHGVFMQSPLHHLSGKGCAVCGGVKAKPTSDLLEQFKAVHGNRYDYSSVDYKSSDTPVSICCGVHGMFEQLTTNHLKGSGCPKCACYSTSKEESLLNKIFPEARSSRNVLPDGKELDLYFGEHKVAVEMNGNYWHSDKFKDRYYHRNKTDECSKLGIKLFHFSDVDVRLRQPIVLSMINNALGKSRKIFARKTKITLMTYLEVKSFFNANHISGFANHSVAYGLILDGEVVCVMSFAKPRYDKTHEWEIIRLASKVGCTVIGGAGKLFKEFILKHNPKSVVSYADLRYGSGNVYTKMGFEFVRDTAIGYSYFTDNGIEVSRYKAQKHKLPKLLGDKFNLMLSESENMRYAKYRKVYNCGHNLYSYKAKNHPKVV